MHDTNPQKATHKTHWPTRTDAQGKAMPACNAQPSVYHKPLIAKRLEDVTCEICKRRVRKFQ